MPKRLEFKLCRICGAKVFGIRRHTRNAFWYPRQCEDCFHKPRNPKKWKAGVMRGLEKARAAATKPIGSTRMVSRRGFNYLLVKTESGWRYQHRVIAEADLGRTLMRNENAHHRNGNTLDNRPENIEVMTHGAHTTKHHKLIGRWSLRFPACRICGTSSKRHLGFGLCSTCYQRQKR